MATRVVPTSLDADNPAGSFMLAACSDWRSGVRRFHVGTGLHEPTSDAGYTTAGSPLLPQLSINLLPCGGSPYTRVRLHDWQEQPDKDRLSLPTTHRTRC